MVANLLAISALNLHTGKKGESMQPWPGIRTGQEIFLKAITQPITSHHLNTCTMYSNTLEMVHARGRGGVMPNMDPEFLGHIKPLQRNFLFSPELKIDTYRVFTRAETTAFSLKKSLQCHFSPAQHSLERTVGAPPR